MEEKYTNSDGIVKTFSAPYTSYSYELAQDAIWSLMPYITRQNPQKINSYVDIIDSTIS